MKLGAVFPQTEIGADPVAIRDFVQAVEGLGFDYLLAYDHVLGANPDRPGGWRGPYTYRDLFHEPFVLFAHLAALTWRLEFVTGILILPQRQTALVAKQAAELDLLSGGRLRLGVGLGWNAVEYQALGEDFTNRGRRIEEQVALLRELWTRPLVQFTGDYHQIPDAGLNPLPVQQPIPIWFGGTAEAALRRLARLGDGWLPNSMPAKQLVPEVEKVRGYVAEAGRDPRTFGIDVRMSLKVTPEAEWPQEAALWRAQEVSHLCLVTMGVGFTSPDQHLAAFSRFKAAVS